MLHAVVPIAQRREKAADGAWCTSPRVEDLSCRMVDSGVPLGGANAGGRILLGVLSGWRTQGRLFTFGSDGTTSTRMGNPTIINRSPRSKSPGYQPLSPYNFDDDEPESG
jgi:hypothetical protein